MSHRAGIFVLSHRACLAMVYSRILVHQVVVGRDDEEQDRFSVVFTIGARRGQTLKLALQNTIESN